jgi:hypothetical protein
MLMHYPFQMLIKMIKAVIRALVKILHPHPQSRTGGFPWQKNYELFIVIDDHRVSLTNPG